MFSSYSPQHAAPSQLGRPLQAAVLVTGLTATLGLPALTPSAAAAGPTPTTASTGPALAAPVKTAPVLTSTAPGTVRFGSRGADVAEVQRILGISADGVFGAQTRAAVIGFQKSRGLTADGIVGPKTWAALRGGAAPAAAASPQVVAASAAAPTPVSQGSSLGARAIAEAAKHAGKPYRYGAAGPNAFDCSGFVQYVYSQLGVSLPRTSGAQYNALPKVGKPDVRIGDLVFMRSGGRISHVGIYAGDNTMWVARRSGTTITQQRIWTSDFLVARVG